MAQMKQVMQHFLLIKKEKKAEVNLITILKQVKSIMKALINHLMKLFGLVQICY